MSRSELDGHLDALARLHGKTTPAADASKQTRRVKSKRQPVKKKRR